MFSVIMTTASSHEEAVKISKTLLDKKLCACVQISPVESFYHWKGKIESSKEFSIAIKTEKSLYEQVEQEILKLHSYEVPEILSFDVKAGFSGYLNWIKEEVEVC